MIYAGGAVLLFVMFMAPMIGFLAQPLAPWWLGKHTAAPGGVSVPVEGFLADQPEISDEQRYALALVAGFSALEAITATAISIAEDGSGNPAALSGMNRDGSRDLGLWQINSGWWSQFGGPQALTNPANNARAAYSIYQRQHWCAWSTYLASCGPGHTGSFAAFISRAERAANASRHQ